MITASQNECIFVFINVNYTAKRKVYDDDDDDDDDVDDEQ